MEDVDFSEAAGMGRPDTDLKGQWHPAFVAKKRMLYALIAFING
jgi:hypothetical protein